MTEMCACGQPLHYLHPDSEAAVRKLVDDLGPTIPVKVEGGARYAVPRHYIALHGIKASELDELARRYGWEHA